jgi:uncharacterized membrane protein YqjE
MNQRSPGSALDAMPTGELMRQVLDETKALVRIEMRLARDELDADLRQLKQAAIFAGVALLLAFLAFSTLVMALLFAIDASGGGALVVAGVLLVGGGAFAALAFQRVPKPPLARTRDRLKHDVTELEEHLQ